MSLWFSFKNFMHALNIFLKELFANKNLKHLSSLKGVSRTEQKTCNSFFYKKRIISLVTWYVSTQKEDQTLKEKNAERKRMIQSFQNLMSRFLSTTSFLFEHKKRRITRRKYCFLFLPRRKKWVWKNKEQQKEEEKEILNFRLKWFPVNSEIKEEKNTPEERNRDFEVFSNIQISLKLDSNLP